ncbi:MAG: hypothetical protein KDA83_16330 [Planctomycetales bacterium]|nr:hypothetical protein [Planctomycetales bacterium]
MTDKQSAFRIVVSLTVALLLGTGVMGALRAEEREPGYVVKFAPAKQLFEEGRQLIEDIGMSDALFLIGGYEFQLKRCLDIERPWGLYGNWEVAGGEPVACFPATNPEGLAELLSLSLGTDWEFDKETQVYSIGEASKNPDYFIKVVGDWCFGHSQLSALDDFPEDPASWFEVESDELIVAELHSEQITDEAFQAFIDLADEENEALLMFMSPAERRAFEEQNRLENEGLKLLVDASEIIRVSLAVESDSRALVTRLALNARAGQDLTELVAIAQTPTSFPAFATDSLLGLAVSFDFSPDSVYADSLRLNVRSRLAMLEQQRGAIGGLPRGTDGYTPFEFPRAVGQAVLDQIDEGRFDMGATLNMAAGGGMPEVLIGVRLNHDALDELEAATIRFMEYFDEQAAGALAVKINAHRTGDVRWHMMEFPVPGARQLAGQTADVNFGFGDEEFYLTFGTDPMERFAAISKRNKRLQNQGNGAGEEEAILESQIQFDVARLLPAPNDRLSRLRFPRASEDLREGKPFLITGHFDSTPQTVEIEIRIDNAVLHAAGDQIDEVLETLESLDPAAGAGAPRF